MLVDDAAHEDEVVAWSTPPHALRPAHPCRRSMDLAWRRGRTDTGTLPEHVAHARSSATAPAQNEMLDPPVV